MAADATQAREKIDEYFHISQHWPEKDAVLTVLRYLLLEEIVRGAKVLEVGCGPGEGALVISRWTQSYTGVDHRPHWADGGIDSPANVRFLQCDACHLPKEWKESFDVVVAFEIIEHVDDPTVFLDTILRVLKPGGVAVISTPNFALLSKRPGTSRTPLFEHHQREFCAREFEEVLEATGMPCRVFGLSQLPPTDEAGRVARCICGEKLFEVNVAGDFLAAGIISTLRLRRPIEPEYSQGVLAVLNASRRRAPGPKARKRAGISNLDAALESVFWMLQRRNEHVAELQGALSKGDAHIAELSAAMEERLKDISILRKVIEERDGRSQEANNGQDTTASQNSPS